MFNPLGYFERLFQRVLDSQGPADGVKSIAAFLFFGLAAIWCLLALAVAIANY